MGVRLMTYYEKFLVKSIVVIFLLLLVTRAQAYTLDEYADAIHSAENNDNYGIISIPCVKGEQCRQYCKNTVYNTLIKYRLTRCKPEWGDLECIANRYCPVGSDTDDGTCQYWKKNVKWFLENPNDRD